ncbi:MAG: hypothetical protein QOE37_901 [Microbacteriaceae bacterium]|nr:hypothetical protein [Microbacteriaceae bacterium]
MRPEQGFRIPLTFVSRLLHASSVRPGRRPRGGEQHSGVLEARDAVNWVP